MNKFQLYRLLRKNTNLSYKRSPAFEQNKWAKGLIYFGAVMFGIYLIMYGCIIGASADGTAGFMLGAKAGGTSSNLANGYELFAIAGCTIGGVSVNGGTGKVSGILMGGLVVFLTYFR